MTHTLLLPPRPLVAKPRRDAPCNGCGWCCWEQPCSLAVDFLGCDTGPCVALEFEADRTYCGLVRRPVHYLLHQHVPDSVSAPLSVDFASALGLGMGCDADDPN